MTALTVIARAIPGAFAVAIVAGLVYWAIGTVAWFAREIQGAM